MFEGYVENSAENAIFTFNKYGKTFHFSNRLWAKSFYAVVIQITTNQTLTVSINVTYSYIDEGRKRSSFLYNDVSDHKTTSKW